MNPHIFFDLTTIVFGYHCSVFFQINTLFTQCVYLAKFEEYEKKFVVNFVNLLIV